MTRLFIPALLIAFIGCQQSKQQSDTVPANGNHATISTVSSVRAAAGDTAPDFSWTDSTGTTVTFSHVTKGKPVLVNFWATWCGPCRKETPDLVALSKEYAGKGAVIIGISADRDADAPSLVGDFKREFGIDYTLVIDNGDLESAFGGLRGYPTTFYIDRNGTIVKKLVGLQSKETFTKEFDALL